MNNISELLKEGLPEHGIPIPYRVHISNGFMRWGKSMEYWAVAVGDGYSYGNWKEGTKYFIFPNNRSKLTEDERKQIANLQVKARLEQEHRQKEAALEAQRIFDSLPKAVLQHPYLVKKCITEIPDNIKQNDQALVVPVQNIYGELTSLQFIDNDGKKRFLSQGRKKRCFYMAGKVIDGEPICLCEGVVTGLSLYAILKLPVVVAFDAGNLKPVAIDLRRKYPNSRIIIAADNDCKNTEYNTGIEKARETAVAIDNAIVIYPMWVDKEKNLIRRSVDWNDIYCEYKYEVDSIRKKIELNIKLNIECIKFYTHEAKLSKQNDIFGVYKNEN